MPEAGEQPAKREQSMVGFYIAVGVFAALLGLGAWLWTPARICYWEWQARRGSLKTDPATWGTLYAISPCTQAARRLASIGPASLPAFKRLLQTGDSERRIHLIWGLELRDWALPLLADLARDERNLETGVTHWAVVEAEFISNRKFRYYLDEYDTPQVARRSARDRFLAWWEAEGQAKYGSSR